MLIIYYEFFTSNIKSINLRNEFIIDKEFFNYERNLIIEGMKKNAQWNKFPTISISIIIIIILNHFYPIIFNFDFFENRTK